MGMDDGKTKEQKYAEEVSEVLKRQEVVRILVDKLVHDILES